MALFSKKNKKAEVETKTEKPSKKVVVAGKAETQQKTVQPVKLTGESISAAVIVAPRVTEKVTLLMETRNVYTFEVNHSATKKSVADVIKKLYKVTPEKVSIVNIPRKRVFVRGKNGVKTGGRKAYVYLKSGDKIETA